MPTLDERYEQGLAMRTKMAGGNPSHFTLPGTDQLAPDLKRIIDEALFGSIWTRPGLELKYRCICTVSALMALGELPLLRRHIERSLNVGLTPTEGGGSLHPAHLLRGRSRYRGGPTHHQGDIRGKGNSVHFRYGSTIRNAPTTTCTSLACRPTSNTWARSPRPKPRSNRIPRRCNWNG